MADFVDSEAEESEEEEELDVHERKKLKKLKAVSDSSEEDEEDDEERLREELKDLIDDNPIEEDGSDNDDSDGSGESKKRKKHDDDDLDDRLEDDDYDLIEENLGVKVERRKRFKRLRRIQDNESDGEEHVDEGLAREAIAEQLFDENDESIDRRSLERSTRETDAFDDEETDSDADDFIVDDNGRPIADKKKKRRPIFTDASLQEGQDIFGVDFDYDDFVKHDEDEYEDDSEGDDYDEEGAGGDDERSKTRKKTVKKKVNKKTIFDIYEPSELKRGHFTDLDNDIRKTDIPERMQLRQIPVTSVPEGSNELELEAEWIYKHAFCKQTVSLQEKPDTPREKYKKPPSTVAKIKQTLDFIRNQQLEVPFIGFYRKEYVRPELNIEDLWKVYYFDERWCQLTSRKNKLLLLFEKMRNYQLNELCKDSTAALPDDVRLIKDGDFERLQEVQSMHELKDVHAHFLLHYAQDIPKMQEEHRRRERERRQKSRRERALNRENGEENVDDANRPVVTEDDEPEPEEQLKHAKDTGAYATCRKAGICGFAKRFGLAPEQFAENLRDSYQRNEVDQESLSPSELAKQYLSQRFMTIDEVIHAVKYVVAQQLAREPLLRKTVREVFFERAKINVHATRRGLLEIDENHPCYSMKYLAKKPVNDLYGDQYLKLLMAEEQKLIEINISDEIDGNAGGAANYIDEAKQLYHLDQFSKTVQEWNALRADCVEVAFKKFLIPDLFKELRAELHEEAKECVLRSCCAKLNKWLNVAPYRPSFPVDYTYDEWSTVKGIRVLGLAYEPDIKSAAFCAITTPEGDISDYLRLPHILRRKNSNRAEDKALKMSDLRKLTDFIRNKKPHVIVIGGESREAQMLQADIKDLLKELADEDQFPPIDVEIIDNELAKIYANSKKGNSDFKEYPLLLKQAVSLARKMQDPLIEYSQLCDADDEIMCLRFHTLQEQLPREHLMEHLYIEFINRTNEVGLDINMTVQNSRTINLIQFICGLGPRKGQALIKILKQSNQRLENRTQLVTLCHLGPKVFINCSGFIKIDTSSLGDSTEAYVEVLDGSRVHPETYEWARKMAIDAMEYDDEETNPAGALEEILESPERLKDLDLDAFAVELERQGFGSKSITLYDIRNELSCLYKDYRAPYRSPNAEELFDMLTKETPDSFYVGKCIQAEVINITHRKPQVDQLDQANPVRIEGTGMWQCPFCQKDDFPELSDVWNHFDANACPGQAIGLRVRLENGLPGFIHMKNFSDKPVKKLEDRVRSGQTIHVRIIKIDIDRFSVDCSSKTTDLHDVNHEFRPRRDQYYDYTQEKKDERKYTEQKKKQQMKAQCKRRVIAHPSFVNKTYMEILEVMKNMDQGEVVLRPSSKGYDHITATWKVTDDIYQHIDVREEGNENDYSVGRSLWIGNEEFEDLDEIIARHINPMAMWARELLNFKYYRDTNGGMKDKMEELLREEKTKDPKKIHYFISASKNYPGKFLLSYLPKLKSRHEYVTVVPEGFRFRGQIFASVNLLLKWFKEHYTDPIATPISATPHAMSNSSMRPSAPFSSGGSSTRSHGGGDSRSSYSGHSHSGSAHNAHYGSVNSVYGGYINTPYTPSGQTPFMTPYNSTPHTTQTPRYGHNVPSPSSTSTSNIGGYERHPYAGRSTDIMGSSSGGPASNYSNTTPVLRYYDMSGVGGGGCGGSSSGSIVGQNAYTTGSRSKESLEWQLASDSWARRKPNQSAFLSSGNVGGRDIGKTTSPMINDYTTCISAARMLGNYGASSANDYHTGGPLSMGGSGGGVGGLGSSALQYGADERVRGKEYISKSARSTPRTNTSPHSMNLGDSTPLYDEN